MNRPARKPLGGILLIGLFAAPILLALGLTLSGWHPAGTRSHGELLQPPQDIRAARFVLADGSTLGWQAPEMPWTLFALPGPGCSTHCMERLDELRRVRVSMNQNDRRLRVLVLDPALAPELAPLEPLTAAVDKDGVLAAWRPSASDTVAVAVADPHGYLVLRYLPGYDASGLRKDLGRVIK
ncbi:MAG: hypothetical protein J0H15_13480 [Xanthomonadales bacterium]|nr:hypothetical protein [Xanthomonadales bacterium]